MRAFAATLSVLLCGCSFDTSQLNSGGDVLTVDVATETASDSAPDDFAPDAPEIDAAEVAIIDVEDVSAEPVCPVMCSGVCTDVSSDVHHCGGCDTDCTTAPNINAAGVGCTSGTCVIFSNGCAAAFGDCNHVASDGCETSLSTSSDCGACGMACTMLRMCVNAAGAWTCI